MEPLVQFLWDRRAGGRPSQELNEWACALLEQGIESDALLLLAAEPQMDSRDQQKLLTQALRDLGAERLLDAKVLRDAYVDAFQLDVIAAYYEEKLDGESLIRQCLGLYYNSDEPKQMQFWIGIAEDSWQHGGQGICLQYPFNERSFDEALEVALTENGLPRPR
jgi:hypothetical protein